MKNTKFIGHFLNENKKEVIYSFLAYDLFDADTQGLEIAKRYGWIFIYAE